MLLRQLTIGIYLVVLSIWNPSVSHAAPSPEDLDVNGIINDSYNLLLNREPEMTDTEFTLYEEVLPMVFDQPEVAILLLETMLADDDPESPAFSFVLANVYYSSDRFDLAEKHYISATEEYPEFLRAWVNLGTLYYTLENYPEAISCFTKAIALGNQDAQVRGLLGYSLIEENNPIAAEAAFLQALVADPHNNDWTEALINLYLDSKQYDRAELLIKDLIKLKPEEKSSWTLYLSVLLSTDRKVEAILVLDNLNNLGMSGIEDFLLLGDLYAEHGLFTEALAAYESALKVEPITGKSRLLRYAKSLIYLESYDKAEKVLSVLAVSDSDEQQIELMELKAQLLQGRGEFDQSIQILNEILSLEPFNGEALLSLGRIYSKTGEYAKAEFMLQQAKQLPEFSFHASLELATLSVKNRHYQEAINYLRDALLIKHVPEIESYILKLEALHSSP